MNTVKPGRTEDEEDPAGNKNKRILLGTLVPMVVLMLLLLAIVSRYISQYDRLLENLAISSEFNLHFKDDVDLGMYSIAVGTEENSYLPEVMKSVRDAEKILNKLKENTSSSESRKKSEASGKLSEKPCKKKCGN